MFTQKENTKNKQRGTLDPVSQKKGKAPKSAPRYYSNSLDACLQRQENKTGLPDNLKSGMENLSGQDLSNVRVHTNSSKPESLNAHAYTQGTDIHVAPGQEKHLPHEAWHAVQQMQGRVKPTGEVGGQPLNDSPALEQEADKMGQKASQMKAEQPQL